MSDAVPAEYAEAVAMETRKRAEAVRKRRAAEAKGKRLELRAKAWLESRGAKVELAPKVVQWIYDKKAGRRRPISRRHDFFGVWDGIVVSRQGGRSFIQVTTLTNVAHKRSKILALGFPATVRDRIFAREGRAWRVLSGPVFEMPGVKMKG